MAANYPGVNKDLLVTGALLHDVGSFKATKWVRVFRNDQGRLVGHLVLGIQMVTEAVADLRSTSGAEFFPPEYEWPLQHLLASHHGLKEWGSPVEPASLEACILHHADYLMPRSPISGGASETSGGRRNWTNYDQNLQNPFTFLLLIGGGGRSGGVDIKCLLQAGVSSRAWSYWRDRFESGLSYLRL